MKTRKKKKEEKFNETEKLASKVNYLSLIQLNFNWMTLNHSKWTSKRTWLNMVLDRSQQPYAFVPITGIWLANHDLAKSPHQLSLPLCRINNYFTSITFNEMFDTNQIHLRRLKLNLLHVIGAQQMHKMHKTHPTNIFREILFRYDRNLYDFWH